MFRKTMFGVFLIVFATLILIGGCSSKTEKPAVESNSPQQTSGADTSSQKAAPSKDTGYNLVYKHPDMQKVEVKKDVVYKTDNGKQLKLDVYYPLTKKEVNQTHTVLLVHGVASTDSLKDTMVYQSWGRVVAASGFTAVTFNWRPGTAEGDVSELIKYVREHAHELNLNPDSISVIAFSAGVKQGVKEALQTNTGFLKGIVVYYGELDNSILASTKGTLPPMLIAMGGLDSNFPPNINDKFVAEAKARGCKITSLVQPKGGHGFDVFNDDEETTKIINQTLDFVKTISPK